MGEDKLRSAADVLALGTDFSASDTVAIPSIEHRTQEAIYVGAGTLRITTAEGRVVNFADGELSAGVPHPIRVEKIHSTGTTATAVKLLYN